jgi:hypothetical protein
MVSPSLTASSAWAARTTWSRATRTRALTKKGYFFMLPATRNNSTEAVNESGKFCKAPKLFGKTKRWKAGLTSFNHTVEAIAKYFLAQRIMWCEIQISRWV